MFPVVSTGARRSAPVITLGVIILVCALLLQASAGNSPAAPRPQLTDASRPPVHFEPNVGQIDAPVSYVARVGGGTLYFGNSDLVIAPEGNGQAQAQTLRMEFVGANAGPGFEAGSRLPGKVNYLLGSDPSRWYTGVPTYDAITYRSLYDGVDLKYVGHAETVESIYTIAPNSNANALRWRYTGAQEVTVDAQGNLQVTAGTSDSTVAITEHMPVAWQTIRGKQVPVSVRYEVAADNTIAFALSMASAIAYPKPRVAPVMTTTLSFSNFSMVNLYLPVLVLDV